MNIKNLGDRLREERKRLKLTQKEFAELGGVKISVQYLYEKGKRKPNIEYLLKIREGGVYLNYLLYGDKDGPEVILIEHAEQILLLVDEYARVKLIDVKERRDIFKKICKEFSGFGFVGQPIKIDSKILKKALDKKTA